MTGDKMKFFLISDNLDTQVGMRLAGVDGVVVHSKDELETACNQVLKNPDIAILLISEKLVDIAPEFIKEQKLNNRSPHIVELPDRHGSSRPGDYMLNYIREAIGVKF
jgi:V/A-type H+-transporting ATPase subunit F